MEENNPELQTMKKIIMENYERHKNYIENFDFYENLKRGKYLKHKTLLIDKIRGIRFKLVNLKRVPE